MEKLKLNSSGITHTSNPFHAELHSLNGVFNLRQGHMESMDYFYKRFDSFLTICKFTGCDETSFPCLDKHSGGIKDSGKHMDAMCIIESTQPQLFSHIWNGLENGTILG